MNRMDRVAQATRITTRLPGSSVLFSYRRCGFWPTAKGLGWCLSREIYELSAPSSRSAERDCFVVDRSCVEISAIDLGTARTWDGELIDFSRQKHHPNPLAVARNPQRRYEKKNRRPGSPGGDSLSPERHDPYGSLWITRRRCTYRAVNVSGTFLPEVIHCQRLRCLRGTTRPSSGVYSILGMAVTLPNRRLAGTDRIHGLPAAVPQPCANSRSSARAAFASWLGVALIWAQVHWLSPSMRHWIIPILIVLAGLHRACQQLSQSTRFRRRAKRRGCGAGREPKISIESLQPLVQQRTGEPYSGSKVENTMPLCRDWAIQ